MIQPYTEEDLERGRSVVRQLHGIEGGLDGWAECIAKHLAAERERERKRIYPALPASLYQHQTRE